MKVTKYAHACFVAEHDGKALIVDPGGWSDDLQPYDNTVGVVVTHNHPDHLDRDLLIAIVTHNPDVTIYGPEDVIAQLDDAMPTQTVSAGQTVSCGPFELAFFGGDHAVIHPSLPGTMNVGVLINDKLYYPGDSFTKPERPVATLALPAAAPWMKLSEAMDFVTELKPSQAFPTHDAILSDTGKQLADSMLGAVAKDAGVSYRRLGSTESIEIQ